MFQTEVVEKVKHTLHVQLTFSLEKRAIHEIKWKNMVELVRPQMAIWCMRIVCCIPKTTNTHSEYIIIIDFSFQQQLHKGISVLICICIACLVVF
jgi:hypothetical protein